jgi:hypothetical protein
VIMWPAGESELLSRRQAQAIASIFTIDLKGRRHGRTQLDIC